MSTSTRQTGAERRETIIDAAVEEVARSGFAGATTGAVARRAGISQPYIFRFFPTKQDLSLAVIDRAVGRVLRDWEAALPQPGESRLQALGRAYVEGIGARRSELMVHFHAYAAANDPAIAEAMRDHLSRIYRYVVRAARRDGLEQPEWEAAAFIGRGLLITASMAIGLESALAPEEWAGVCSKAEVARVGDLPGAYPG